MQAAPSVPLADPVRPASTIRVGVPRRRPHLLLDLPIFWRLTLGFLLAAIIAALAAGISGFQRATSLSKESAFYQSLLASNTSLTSADSFIQLMNTEVHGLVSDASSNLSQETITLDLTALQGLAARYDTILQQYARSDLVSQHADQVAFLQEAGHGTQVAEQGSLTASVLRTWQVYRDAQSQLTQDVTQDLVSGNLADAETFLRAQVEPTNADAQSALRALIQLDGRIASSVSDAAVVEQRAQLIVSLIAALLAFLGVGLVGWVISGTLVRRLRDLRRVTLAVEQGEVEERVEVVGRDEVARVSASVNGMLDTIVGLLEVTRRQRDALTNAAERLFADVRVAGAGDLRVNAAVSSDPVGMLANAFNFTVGRFRRFVLRTRTSVEQLDVVGRQQLDRAEAFLVTGAAPGRSASQSSVPTGGGARIVAASRREALGGDVAIVTQTERARELVRQVAREGANHHSRAALDFAEQAYLSAGQINQLAVAAHTALAQRNVRGIDEALRRQMEELQTLGTLLAQVGTAAQAIQRNTTARLSDLDVALQEVAHVARATGTPVQPSAASPSVAQYDELQRLTSTFAHDVMLLARQTLAVAQELRAGAAPFRLGAQPQESPLFAAYPEDAASPNSQPGAAYSGAAMPGRMPDLRRL